MAAKQCDSVAIIGSGIIGRNWAMVFASGGCQVRIFDKDQRQVEGALSEIEKTLNKYEKDGSLKGSISAAEQFHQISGCSFLQECVSSATYVLLYDAFSSIFKPDVFKILLKHQSQDVQKECVPERLDIKLSVMSEIDRYITDDDVIVASSASQIFPSKLSEKMQHKRQVIVTHPLNPPYFLPFVEVVPAPWTDKDVIQRTVQTLTRVGMTPVVLKKETKGFVICRVQHAITAECFKLVRDGVVTAEDLDKLMPYGLGRRYAFLGALEASYLNANGMKDFCKWYGDSIYEMQKDFGPPVKLEGTPLDLIEENIGRRIPLDEIQDRRDWRDKRLAELNKFLNFEEK